MQLDLGSQGGFVLLAIAVGLYSLTAGWLAKHSVSAAFSFLAIGALLGGAGIAVLGGRIPERALLSLLAEITLALVLFSAASTLRIREIEGDSKIVLRLIVIGLPLTIAAGTALALGLFPGISVGLALLMATTLAPTDADLGHQVITDRSVPARIRRVLNVEGGLNDGVAAPVITVAIALAALGSLGEVDPIADAVHELVVAALVGGLAGFGGRWLVSLADLGHTATSSSRQIAVLALALATYFAAAELGASGFIAAFVAGLLFGRGSKKRVESAIGFTEAQSVLLSMLVWLVFGLVVFADHLLEAVTPAVLLYAVLALTLVRMIPVAIALVGQRFDRVTIAFIGWFGPRGLASLVFLLVGLEAMDAVGVSAGPLGPVVAWTVVLSVVLHGFSARPLARWYGRYAERLPADSPEFIGDQEPRRKGVMLNAPAELQPVHPHRTHGAD